jgi:hypothetical protein
MARLKHTNLGHLQNGLRKLKKKKKHQIAKTVLFSPNQIFFKVKTLGFQSWRCLQNEDKGEGGHEEWPDYHDQNQLPQATSLK